MRLRASNVVLCAGALWMAAGTVSAQDAVKDTTEEKAPRVRLMADYVDTVKVGGGEEIRSIKIYFDYDNGIARRTTRDAAGTVIEDKVISGTNVRPTSEEFQEAVDLVLADRVIGGMVSRVKAVPDGGFLLEEPEGRACGPRSRCIHVLWLSPDRVGLVRWTVVDLVRQTIAYRAYIPPENIAAMQEVSK